MCIRDRNRIERAVILCEEATITASDLDLTSISEPDEVAEDLQLSDLEKRTIEKTLHKHQYNISKTAEELGLSRAALYRRIEKFGIDTND